MADNSQSEDIELDMTDPDVSEAFAGAKVGDSFTVSAVDDSKITLTPASPEAEPDADDAAAPPDATATGANPAVMAMAQKQGM